MITLVSNYHNTRVGMYVNGVLQYEEDETRRKSWSYDGIKRSEMSYRDIFQWAADLFTVARIEYEWKEADPSWLKRRVHFPIRLSRVHLA